MNYLTKLASLLTGQIFNKGVLGFVQAGLSLLGSQAATQRQNDAARFSAQQGQFQPYNIYGGGGAVQFDSPFSGGQQGNQYQRSGNIASNFGFFPQYGGPGTQRQSYNNPSSWGVNNMGGNLFQQTANNSQSYNNSQTANNSQPYNYPQSPQTQSNYTPANKWDPYAYQRERISKPLSGIKGSFDPITEIQRSLEFIGGPPMDTSPLPLKDPRNVFTNLDPQLQGASNYLMGSGQDLLDSQIQGPRDVGGYGGYGLNQFQNAQNQASPYFNAAGNQINQDPGNSFFSQLQANPYNIASNEFNKMESVLQPGRDRQSRALDEKLLSQGRLGSSGGALSEQALQSAFGHSSNENLATALQTGMRTQSQLFNMGSGLENLSQNRASLLSSLGIKQGGFFGNLGSQMTGVGGQFRGQDINLRAQDIAKRAQDIGMSRSGLERLMSSLKIQQSPLDLLRVSSGLGGNSQSNGVGAKNLFTAGQNAADATAASYGSMGKLVGGLFGGNK